MTIDEAIRHAEEVASRMFDDQVHCIKCAEEHRQLAEWLRDYKRLLEQEPCEDCIGRAKAIENIKHTQLNFSVKSEIDFTKYKREVQEIADGILNAQIKALSELPSVQPKPKTGHWIPIYQGDEVINYRCSECEFGNTFGKKPYGMKYCPNCGAKMESEGMER